MSKSSKLNLDNTFKLYEEALTLIPGGILGIRRPYNFVEGEYPIFFESAKGGKVTDVDGNTYIDYLCAYGPIILGHREKEIDDAVIRQMQEKGFCMSLTQRIQNQLASKLKSIIPCFEKGVFVKTGSDATTTAIRVARAYTNKLKVLRCGYHGWHDWCVEVKGGVPEKLYEDVHEFQYNNLDEVESLMKTHGDNTAAIIVTPVGHPLAHEVEMPKPGFLEGVKEIAKKYGAVLIFDEIRSGFRVNIGGAQKEFNVTPDIGVFGKAMANGHSIGLVCGKKEIMDVLVKDVFLSSTFFPNSLAYTAALKNLEIMERENVIGKIKEKGNNFAQKLQKIVDNSSIPCRFSGGPWMPFITFIPDKDKKYKARRVEFYTQLIRRGIFLQPYHHGYIAFRHTEEDLNYTVGAIEEVLNEMK